MRPALEVVMLNDGDFADVILLYKQETSSFFGSSLRVTADVTEQNSALQNAQYFVLFGWYY